MSIQGDKLKGIADAIRAKEKSTGAIPANAFAERIGAIQTGTETGDATAVAADILTGKTAYAKGARLTGAMPDRGTVSQTLSTTGSSYTIPSGRHSGTGKVTASITNLTAANVKQGVTVGGVAGTFTNDATAAAADILSGKTAFVSGNKLTGNMENQGAWGSSNLSAGGQVTIPKGFHSGAGRVTAVALSGQTQGTATAGDIMQGKTAWVNGSRINGTNTGPIITDKLFLTVVNNEDMPLYAYIPGVVYNQETNSVESYNQKVFLRGGTYYYDNSFGGAFFVCRTDCELSIYDTSNGYLYDKTWYPDIYMYGLRAWGPVTVYMNRI